MNNYYNLINQQYFKNIPADTIAGILVGINIIITCLSYSGLILTGALQGYILLVFEIFLFSSLFISVVLLLFSREPLAIGTPSNQIIAIIAVLATNIALSLASSTSLNNLYHVTIFTISISTILTGITFFLIGYFNLGNLIRYIPYPVSSGFLAGSGWIICHGAINFFAGKTIHLNTYSELLQPQLLIFLIGIFLWALIVYVLVTIYKSSFILPICILISIAAFYFALVILDISINDAIKLGLLLPADNHRFNMTNLDMLNIWHYADFSVLYQQSTTIAATIFVSCISLFLNIIGLEFVSDREINSNKELKIAGVSNVIIGSLGGITSFISLSNANIAKKAGAQTKLAKVIVIAVIMSILLFALPYLVYFPRLILSCTLMYFGMTLIFDTFFSNWLKLSLLDFLLTLFILLEIIFFGLLPGLFLGTILAAILFVVNYSRINVVHFVLRGKSLHSNTQRSMEINAILEAKRKKIIFFKLGGYIFFGTANHLLNQIKSHFKIPIEDTPKYIILDFTLVNGLDSSALMIFTKMNQISKKYSATIILTNLSEDITAQFQSWKIIHTKDKFIKYMENNDLALEWCERELLAEEAETKIFKQHQSLTLTQTIHAMMPTLTNSQIDSLRHYFEEYKILKNMPLFLQDDISNALYFIESGEVSILLRTKSGKVERLRKIGPGNIVGEMGLYNQRKRVASAIAISDCVLYKLSKQSLDAMRKHDDVLAMALDRLIITMLSERLAFLDKQVRQLL